MKRVYTAPNSLMVDHLKLVLDSAGIDSIVEHRFLSSAVGIVPAQEAWPELWVLDDDDEARARALIAEATAGGEERQQVCLACGERLGEHFGTCWHCGAEVGSMIRPASFHSEDDRPLPPPRRWNALVLIAAAAAALAALAVLRACTR
jgi:hypothetical protein